MATFKPEVIVLTETGRMPPRQWRIEAVWGPEDALTVPGLRALWHALGEYLDALDHPQEAAPDAAGQP